MRPRIAETNKPTRAQTLEFSRLQRIKNVLPALGRIILSSNLVAFALAAPSGADSDQHDVHRAPAPVSATQEYARPYPCAEPMADKPIPRNLLLNLAQKCDEYRNGDIALVALGQDIPMDTLYKVADATTDAIDEGLDGIVHPRIVPILASPNANAAFEAANRNNCVDASNVENYASRIADQSMHLGPEYIGVVGMTSFAGCDDAARGVSSPEFGGRYMDDYAVATQVPLSSAQIAKEAAVTTHELGHGPNRLLHASALSASGRDVSAISVDGMPNNKAIDIINDFSSYEFDEYGETSSIMGNTKSASQTALNSFQTWKMMWPDRVKGKIPDYMTVVGDLPVTIEKPSEPRHQFAMVKLDQKVEMTIPSGDQQKTFSYDSLIFDPQMGGHDRTIVRIYLGGRENAGTLLLATMSGGDKDTSERTFTVYNKSVTLKIESDRFSVQVN